VILLDTNVISEMAKERPALAVMTWLDVQLFESLFISTITIAEVRFGILILPPGRRRDAISAALAQSVRLFQGRVLAFDQAAAESYGLLAVTARMSGKGFPTPDGYIAAIAASRGFTVATRDVAPFEAGGVHVVNPWNQQS
jgi:predicted nucleic acid-binding protein